MSRIKTGAVNCSSIAAAAVVNWFANTNRTVVAERNNAARQLPRVRFTFTLFRKTQNTAAASIARVLMMLIALHGTFFISTPPKLHKIEAITRNKGPFRSVFSMSLRCLPFVISGFIQQVMLVTYILHNIKNFINLIFRAFQSHI